MTLEKRNTIFTIILGIIIVVLGWWLYHSIVDPYKVVEERQRLTKEVRYNMGQIRDGMVRYNRREDHFPPTDGGLDSLVKFIQNDSLMVAQRDSLFKNNPQIGYTFKVDSLIYSPRPPYKRFKYTLNDTSRTQVYELKDPDSNDKIGNLEKANLLNAPNWE